jgi:hypothetical protein
MPWENFISRSESLADACGEGEVAYEHADIADARRDTGRRDTGGDQFGVEPVARGGFAVSWIREELGLVVAHGDDDVSARGRCGGPQRNEKADHIDGVGALVDQVPDHHQRGVTGDPSLSGIDHSGAGEELEQRRIVSVNVAEDEERRRAVELLNRRVGAPVARAGVRAAICFKRADR